MKQFPRFLWIFAFTFGGPAFYQLFLELTGTATYLTPERRASLLATACISIAISVLAGALYLLASVRSVPTDPTLARPREVISPMFRFLLLLGLFSGVVIGANVVFACLGLIAPAGSLGLAWTISFYALIGAAFAVATLSVMRLISQRFPEFTHRPAGSGGTAGASVATEPALPATDQAAPAKRNQPSGSSERNTP